MIDKKDTDKSKTHNNNYDTEYSKYSKRLILFSFLSQFVQHLYIGAGPLFYPLIMKDLFLNYSQLGLTIF